MGGNTIWQLKECAEPAFFFITKFLHLLPSVGIGGDSAYGDHKSVDEVVLARSSTTNVFQHSKGKVMRGANYLRPEKFS